MISTEKTLSEVIAVLDKRGYTENFNSLEVQDSYKDDGGKIDLNDLVIDKIYRFTGQNDVDDEAILYADEKAAAIIEKISVNEVDHEDWTAQRTTDTGT